MYRLISCLVENTVSRIALFWAVTQLVVVIPHLRFGNDRLSRNVSDESPLHAV